MVTSDVGFLKSPSGLTYSTGRLVASLQVTVSSHIVLPTHLTIGSRNLKDNKLLTTTKEIIILHGKGISQTRAFFTLPNSSWDIE